MNTTDQKRRPLLTFAIVAISFAALGLIILAHIRSPVSPSHLSDDLLNSLHAPGFAFVSVAVLALLRFFRRGLTNYLYAVVVTMAIGVLSEAAQIPGPRDASIGDLIADLLGVVAGVGTLALFDSAVRIRVRKGRLIGLGIIATIALALTFLPTAFFAYATASQLRAMPAILTFENPWERTIYRQTWRSRPRLVPAPIGWLSEFGTVAYAEETGRYRTLLRIETIADWTTYNELSFMAASVGEASEIIQVVVRELPDESGRGGPVYTSEVALSSTPRRYTIPLDDIRTNSDRARFDLARVSSISLFATGKTEQVAVYLDDFRLN